MNTIAAFTIGEVYRGNELKVFDWDKAAKLIKESKTGYASAGLDEDWEWTGGEIYRDNEPVTDDYTYLASTWATPKICIDDEFIDCYKMEHEVPDWNAETKWPESALKILNEEGSEEKEQGVTVLDCLNMIDEHRKETRMRNGVSSNDSPANGSVFLKTYPDSRLSNVAYDDGICYVYVDLGGSRTRFTSDWWNATYKTKEEEK